MSSAVKEYRYDSFLLIGIILTFSSLAIVLGRPVLLVGFSGLIICVLIAFINFEFAIIASLVWVFLQYFLTRDLKVLPEVFTLVDECFLVGVGCYLMWNIVNKKIRIKITGFDVALLLFVALGIVSTILNENPIINIVLGLRCYLQYIILYYAITYFDIAEKTCKKFLNVILFMVVLQVPLMIYQYFTWTPSSLATDHDDAAWGTFSYGAANIVGILMLVVIVFLIKVKNDMPKSLKIPLLIMLFFAMILAHSKIAYVMMLGVGIYEYRTKVFSRNGLKKVVVAALVFLVVVKVASMLDNDISNLLSARNLSELYYNQVTDKAGGGRIFYFLLTIEIISKYAFSPFIGLGPAMYSSYAGILLRSPYLTNVLGLDLAKRGTRLDPDLTGIVGEYGYIGLVIFTALLWILFNRSNKIVKYHPDAYWASYASWFSIFVLIFYFGAFVNGLWQAQFFAANFWFAAGIMNRQFVRIQEKEQWKYHL